MTASTVMLDIAPLTTLDPARIETPAVLRKLAAASRQLAELKGVAASIPRQGSPAHARSGAGRARGRRRG